MSTPANTPPQPPPDPPSMKSFDFVADATKQLIAVATGVITVTAVFSKDLSAGSRWLALAAWSVLLLSVLGGVLTLFNMSGLLADGAKEGINERGNRQLSAFQLVTFLFGLLLVLVFGFFAVHGNGSTDKDKPAPLAVTVTCTAPSAPKQDCGNDGGKPMPGGGEDAKPAKPHRNPPRPRTPSGPTAAHGPISGIAPCL